MKKIHLGLLGCGTVGTGVAKILMENKELITSRVGATLNLKSVADIDITSDRGLQFDKGVLTTDCDKVITDPKIDIILEMVGGETVAKDFILKAIENGKHVVTANKALLANQGQEIFQAAEKKGVDLAFEASVGGCMPIIKSIRESLVGNKIKSMIGILNGTCNYILSKITDDGSTFEEALAEAQAKGYAEANSELDVEGYDAAHKLALLTSLAYGTQIDLDNVYIEGISRITPMDVEYARQFGYRIKLLAISKNRDDTVEARVHPTMIPFDNILSNVNGSQNAITVSADAVGDILLYGRGAGMMPTASSAVSDTVDLARNILSGSVRRIPLLSYQMENIRKIPVMPVDQISTHYYIRFFAKDRPGVLSTISGILGENEISIKSVQQKGRKTNGSVPLVMLTHRAREADVLQALAKINSLDVVSHQPFLIRIEDENIQD
ncbi:MAG: homoserine dehydrogenase [Deltaproteobacteria bacterium]|nr:homoserine dehydrogenase [Deltaproteobacteria bacterium]